MGAIIDSIDIQFSNAASTYDNAAYLEQEVGKRLFERLDTLNFSPKNVLDLGCGTGHFLSVLKNKFVESFIIGLDFAEGMLNFANKNAASIMADACHISLADRSIDFIFCNCCIPHIQDPQLLFSEVKRVLSDNGLFLFTTYGPDTLVEIGFQGHWPDMHVAGDLLLKLGFTDPVVDNEIIKLNYTKTADLYLDLQETGAFVLTDNNIANLTQPISVGYEIIYGLAWGQKVHTESTKKSDTFYVEVTR